MAAHSRNVLGIPSAKLAMARQAAVISAVSAGEKMSCCQSVRGSAFTLFSCGVVLPPRPGQGKPEKMLWRVSPGFDPEVEYVFPRDLDALPTWRERCATEEFLASAATGETNAWIGHDNPAHAGMMGGLCGFRAEAVRALYSSLAAFIADTGYSDARWAEHGADQDALNRYIGPRLRVFEHSVFVANDEGGKRIIRQPTQWHGGHPSTVFRTEIAPFDDPAVPVEVRAGGDRLIAYMGIAGHDHSKAVAFYDEWCPVIAHVNKAELESE